MTDELTEPKPTTPQAVGIWSRFSNWSTTSVVALLLLIATLPYINTLWNGFVYDDNTQILDNPYLQSFHFLRQTFSTTVWSYMGVARGTNYYRPIMTLGYLLCYQFFGPVAYGFHLVNILLNAAIVCLLALVTMRLFHDRRVAFLTAVLFALHPIHTEAVAWIASVTELEGAFFYLLAFWFYLKMARPEGKHSEWAQLGVVSSLVLALLSKEQAMTFPVAVALYEHFYREDRAVTHWRQKLSRYGASWLLGIAYLLFRVRFFGAFAPVLQRPNLSWYDACVSAVTLVGQYLWKLLWPVRLCAFYVFQPSSGLSDPRVLGGLAALMICCIIFFVLWRRPRTPSFGFIWLFLTLGPVLNLRWLPGYAERYLYLPSIGFCWIAAWAFIKLWDRVSLKQSVWRYALSAGLVTVAVLYTVRIVTRNRIWRDDVTLYRNTLALQPNALIIRNNLGAAYWLRGDIGGAEREWLAALRIRPDSAIVLTNLGQLRLFQKRYAEAVVTFKHALHLVPRFTTAHLHLGETYLKMHRPKLAELQFRATVGLSPLNIRGRNRLGQLYLDEGELGKAYDQFLHSVESEPNAIGYAGLGDVDLRRGNLRQAEVFFKQALVHDAFNAQAHFGLAEIYARGRQNEAALKEYKKGMITDPKDKEALAAMRKLEGQLPNAEEPSSRNRITTR